MLSYLQDKKEGKHSSSHLTANDNDQGMLLAPPSAADDMKLGGLNLGGGGAPESETITIHSPESGTTSIF